MAQSPLIKKHLDFQGVGGVGEIVENLEAPVAFEQPAPKAS